MIHVQKISRIESFVKGFEMQEWYVGIDVHKTSFAIALRRADGQCYTWISPAEPEALLATFRRCAIQPTRVVQEAGPTGFHLSRVLSAAGMDVRVGAPSRIPRPVTTGAKTDRLDCRKLAEYAVRDMVPGIAIPSVDEELFRGLMRRRRQITKQIQTCKQRVRAELLFHQDGSEIKLRSLCHSHINVLLALDLPPALLFAIRSQVAELRSLEENRLVVDARIEELLQGQPIWEQRRKMLMTMPGVGPCIATTFLAELFRPERFTRGDEVSSYLGLAPMVHHRGEKTPRGRLRPVGQKYLRSLLVEASWVLKTHDPGIGAIYNQVLSRTGIAQKAIIAVARRLAVILWRMALESRPYYPMQT